MLSLEEAQELMNKLIELRKKSSETNDPKDLKALKRQEEKCVRGFAYIITMKTTRYKKFANYEDLVQEGYEALLKGMKNYDPKKGNIFWWLHRYTSTRISRAANFHCVIRYPMKVAKEQIPHRESNIPVLIEEKEMPDKQTEKEQLLVRLEEFLFCLPEKEKEVISLAFGVGGKEETSMGKICRMFSLNRLEYDAIIESTMKMLKENFGPTSWENEIANETEKMFLETEDLMTEQILTD